LIGQKHGNNITVSFSDKTIFKAECSASSFIAPLASVKQVITWFELLL